MTYILTNYDSSPPCSKLSFENYYQSASVRQPAMSSSEPISDVTRGPNLSRMRPRGSLHSALPAMPIVATVFISACASASG
jgi:hypothetical protein